MILFQTIIRKQQQQQALEGFYFNSTPFKRPGSYVLFISLKEGNLDIFNNMIKSNHEFIFEKDHVINHRLNLCPSQCKQFIELMLTRDHNSFDWLTNESISPLLDVLELPSYCDSKGTQKCRDFSDLRRNRLWREGCRRENTSNQSFLTKKSPDQFILNSSYYCSHFLQNKLYYAIKGRMFDVAKYLLFRRANPWLDKSKSTYDSLTSNSIMLRCIRKAKMADVCA